MDPDKDEKDDIKAQMRATLILMQEIAKKIGLDLQKEYGLSPTTSSGGSPGDFWHEAEGSGWDDGW